MCLAFRSAGSAHNSLQIINSLYIDTTGGLGEGSQAVVAFTSVLTSILAIMYNVYTIYWDIKLGEDRYCCMQTKLHATRSRYLSIL